MVEMFLEFSLGPHGEFLRGLYREHQLVINSIIVGAVVYQLVFRKKKTEGNKASQTKEKAGIKEA